VLGRILQRLEIEAARKNVSIKLVCPDQAIRFDPEKFEQVMNNLLNNAITHADPGSAISVTVVSGPVGNRISVTNTGPAIPLADQEHIWDRYYRGTDRHLGTGLGLAIVKSILEHHHVAYGVVSENHETTFWFDSCAITV
jgi:signal transduction histidine kinase